MTKCEPCSAGACEFCWQGGCRCTCEAATEARQAAEAPLPCVIPGQTDALDENWEAS